MEENLKQLLLKDLCSRLPYGVICDRLGQHKKLLAVHPYKKFPLEFDNGEYIPSNYELEDIKPYLRPISSMTEEEQKEFVQFHCVNLCPVIINDRLTLDNESKMFHWLNAHHFDYCGLIEKGLALEALDGMYGKEVEV